VKKIRGPAGPWKKFDTIGRFTPSVRRYGTQTKRFTKPLFPGYVFRLCAARREARIYQQTYSRA